jgi:transcriptional regulator with XRE-family HTH domain
MVINMTQSSQEQATEIGSRIRDLRTGAGFSLRVLAERSGLNINTLSLIENGRTSPSVSTLQQLATALQLPLVRFFESPRVEKEVVFTPSSAGPHVPFGSTMLYNLASDFGRGRIQSFEVELPPGTGSGEQLIVHTGQEMVYCLQGEIHYRIREESYHLRTGDSLIFEAHQPHCWINQTTETTRILLTMISTDDHDNPTRDHFHE